MFKNNEKVFVSHLKAGMTLANGNLVTAVHYGYGWLVYTAFGPTISYLEDQEVEIKGKTNCIYGGNAPGHSHGFCTADSCF